MGLIAWILPIVYLTQGKKNDHKKWAALTVLSFSACTMALSFQIFYSYHLVKIEDWGALLDISGAVAFSAAVLTIGTILLNIVTLMVYRRSEVKNHIIKK